jgi:hypothetical protein
VNVVFRDLPVLTSSPHWISALGRRPTHLGIEAVPRSSQPYRDERVFGQVRSGDTVGRRPTHLGIEAVPRSSQPYRDERVFGQVRSGDTVAPCPRSSFSHYASGEIGIIEIESQRTAFRRGNQLPEHLRYTESTLEIRALPPFAR